MDTVRRPFIVAALILMVLAFGLEVGSYFGLEANPPDPGQMSRILAASDPPMSPDDPEVRRLQERERPPGVGILFLGLIDALLLFTTVLIALGLVVPPELQARTQGLTTLVVGLVTVIVGILGLLATIRLVLTMVTLLLSPPFGTIAYMVVWAFFDRPGAAVVLALLLALKVGFAVCLVLAQPRFLDDKGLVLIVMTSLAAQLILGLLHGLPPGFLVSITDGIGAIVAAVLALIWAVAMILGGLKATVKALKPARS